MTIDQRLEALTQTVELLAQKHKDNERANAEQFAALSRTMDLLAQRSIQFMDTMNRVGRILEIHEERLDSHEGRLDRLEGGQ